MSRRARFWFLALFLGLAVIPMVYLTLTWSPRDPLRFRLIRAPDQSHTSTPTYEVEVVNKSGTAIHLHDGILWIEYGNPPGGTMPGSPAAPPAGTPFFAQLDIDAIFHAWSSAPGSMRGRAVKTPFGFRLRPDKTLDIPSHGTRPIPVRMLEGTGLLPQEGQLRIRYVWISRPRHLTNRACTWLRLHSPALLKPHIPVLKPEDTSTTIAFDKADLAPIHEAGQGRVASTRSSP